jgi:hypothetical protein
MTCSQCGNWIIHRRDATRCIACVELAATDKRDNTMQIYRLRKTLQLPRHTRSRTFLLALRAGYIESNVRLTGYDNGFTRWLWDLYVRINPVERRRMLAYLRWCWSQTR